jgi:hypothetical protein
MRKIKNGLAREMSDITSVKGLEPIDRTMICSFICVREGYS